MPMRWLRRAWPVAVLTPILAGCSFDGPQSTLRPAGPIAQEQMDLFMWTYYLSWPVMILVFGVLAFVIIRFRRRKGEDRMPTQTHGSAVMEVAWTILPVIIVILVAVPTVRSIFRTQSFVEASGSDVVVNVTGYQWWWKFEYPDLGFTTANELHVPVGARVVVHLDSADVLHAFWIPRLAGKVDAIPNQDNQLWFTADEPGIYNGQCAELCLGAHAYMRFRVIAHEPADYEAWVASFQQPQVVLASEDPLVAQGRQLVASKGCIGCHTIGNYAEGLQVGLPGFPNLTNFGLRNTVGAGLLPATAENVAAWIADPQAIKPGNYMPTLWAADDPKRDEETAAIAAYLLSLGAPSDAQAQASADAGGN